ncbi:MAG: serine hydrolase domain-containing protein [Gemmatimonadota bacterium]
MKIRRILSWSRDSIVLALCASACTHSGATPSSPAPRGAAPVVAAATLTRVVDSLFAPFSTGDVPGASVLIVEDGKVLVRRSFGMAELEAHRPVTPATNFRLASLTKQFTAMSVMILADRGQLRFDDAIGGIIPGLPPHLQPITVRQLLNHVSGLADYEDLMSPGVTVPLKDADVLALLKAHDSTKFAPGSEYEYSNSGYTMLAQIVEHVSKQRFADFLHHEIFEPLGMAHTVAFENGISTVSDRAYGYTLEGKSYVRTDQSLTSSVLGDGGIYTSIDDLTRWDAALYTTRLVRAETMAEAVKPAHLTTGGRSDYGFGWFLGDYRGVEGTWHTGTTIGFRNAIRRFPSRGLTIVVLTNRDEAKPLEIADRLADLMLFGGSAVH